MKRQASRSWTDPLLPTEDDGVIIDCHGHYTTAPDALGAYREHQKAELAEDPLHRHVKGGLHVTDDQIRESLESAQLRLQRERGTDLTIFSPRASWMGHHIGNESTSVAWTEHCNDLIHRITELYPGNFAGVAQLPQTPGVPPTACIAELERCVEELGFIGCNLNPDPSGGYWTDPPLGDRWWYPFYEKMFDDTRRYIDAAALSETDRTKIFEGNSRRVFARLQAPATT